jgi:RNA polymerase sigma-70 factor (ECF subfamily)
VSAAVDVDLEGHRAHLRAIALRMTGVVADADDVVQEAFVRALVHPPKDTSTSILPWLVRVTMNVARDHLRRRRRRGVPRTWLPGVVDEDVIDAAFVDDNDALRQLRRKESVRFAYLLALETLTPLQRAVIVLREVFDHSGKETAAILGISDDNVKTVLSRAKKALARHHGVDVEGVEGAGAGAGGVDVDVDGQRAREEAALLRFMTALANDDVDAAVAVLADDVVAVTDGGPFRAAGAAIAGAAKVVRTFVALRKFWPEGGFTLDVVPRNGTSVLDMRLNDPPPGFAPRWVFAVDVDPRGQITRCYSVASPEKLAPASSGDPPNGPPLR